MQSNAGPNFFLEFSHKQVLIMSLGQSGLETNQRNAAGQIQKQLFSDQSDNVEKK